MTPLLSWGDVIDNRCCGDHPGDLDRDALPGSSWCADCLARITDDGGVG